MKPNLLITLTALLAPLILAKDSDIAYLTTCIAAGEDKSVCPDQIWEKLVKDLSDDSDQKIESFGIDPIKSNTLEAPGDESLHRNLVSCDDCMLTHGASVCLYFGYCTERRRLSANSNIFEQIMDKIFGGAKEGKQDTKDNKGKDDDKTDDDDRRALVEDFSDVRRQLSTFISGGLYTLFLTTIEGILAAEAEDRAKAFCDERKAELSPACSALLNTLTCSSQAELL